MHCCPTQCTTQGECKHKTFCLSGSCSLRRNHFFLPLSYRQILYIPWAVIAGRIRRRYSLYKGRKNTVAADVLSQYPTANVPTASKPPPTREHFSELFAGTALESDVFPIKLSVLAYYQQRDQDIQKLVSVDPNVSQKTFRGGEQLLCYKNRIFVPKALRKHVVEWYHTYLLHPGETRTEETIAQHLYWPNIQSLVQEQGVRVANNVN
jgi:hypothetical protein